MKRHLLFGLAMAGLVTHGVANAGSDAEGVKPGPVVKAPAVLQPKKMSCEEFLAVDELYRPQVVYWSEGLNRGSKNDASIDVNMTNTLVPLIIEDCKKEPHASYWAKMKKRFNIK